MLYLLLNYVFLYVAPKSALRGELEIGVIVAEYAFGETGRLVVGVVLAVLLISTISAMTIAGPRVFQVLGEDYSMLKWFAKKISLDYPPGQFFFKLWFRLHLYLALVFKLY